MNSCAGCGKVARDIIQCSACEKYYDFPCSGITETNYRKLGSRQATWKCSLCKVQNFAPKTAENVPAADAAAASGDKEESTEKNSGSSSPNIAQELMAIKETLAAISLAVADIAAIKTDIASLKISMDSRIDSLERRIQVIETSQDDTKVLSQRVEKLEEELNEKNQWMRANNIEIKGVPLKDRENLFDILEKIGNKIHYPIQKNDINFVVRVPSRENNHKPIIVSFLNKYKKEDFVAAARSFKTLCTADINLEGTSRIYINDHLTMQNKILLSKAKALAKDFDFEYIWVKNSKIFGRKNSLTKVFVIKTEKDLEKIY